MPINDRKQDMTRTVIMTIVLMGTVVGAAFTVYKFAISEMREVAKVQMQDIKQEFDDSFSSADQRMSVLQSQFDVLKSAVDARTQDRYDLNMQENVAIHRANRNAGTWEYLIKKGVWYRVNDPSAVEYEKSPLSLKLQTQQQPTP